MKTKTSNVLEPYIPLIEELCESYPELRENSISSFKKIVQLVRTRGTGVVTIDFPKFASIYDSGLSRGFISFEDIPKTLGRVKGNRFHEDFLFRDLLLLTFDEFGVLHGSDPNVVLFTRQLFLFYKKIRLDCLDSNIKSSVQKFFDIERSLRPPTLSWNNDNFVAKRLSFPKVERSSLIFDHRCHVNGIIDTFEQVCDIIISQFPVLDPYSILPRHGPGAVCDMKSGRDKYILSNWPNKLQNLFPHEYFAYSREDLFLSEEKPFYNIEQPAKLIAVPKTQKGPRLITSELTAHQFIQQGILRWIREFLPNPLRLCIDFHSQVPSQAFAKQASITGTSATVDLSSASDLLSCWLVERVFSRSPSLLEALHSCRSRWVYDSTGSSQEISSLKKFAGQGSAVMFPIQTIIYALSCIACVLYDRSIKPSYKNICKVSKEIRVYGDDIVLPSPSFRSLNLLLEYFQLKINVSKTHYSGHFRESCGADYFMGYDVAPVYLRDFSLSSHLDGLNSWCDVSNNAHTKGFWKLSFWMLNKIPTKVRKLIPITDDNSIGCIRLRSFSNGIRINKFRYNKNLFSYELLTFSTTIKEVRKSRRTSDNLLQYFTENNQPGDNFVLNLNKPRRVGYTSNVTPFFKKEWVLVPNQGEGIRRK